MGNGQHRNRRGAHPRPAPHKHGGAGNPNRATTQLIPPAAPARAASGDISPDRGSGSGASEAASEPELPTASGPPTILATERDITPGQDAFQHNPAETRQGSHQPGGGQEPQPARRAGDEPRAEEMASETGPEHTPAVASQAGRGRFERFYAPGQGPRPERAERAERVERVAPPITPALPAVVSAPSTPPRRVERAERPAIVSAPPLDEDDGLEYIGPRADVRGNVGGLIDSLHEVFTRDRSVASQGGAARCGVCYLHFPVAELIYRDAEGFYVCQSCSHALGSARVPMVRRQQRL